MLWAYCCYFLRQQARKFVRILSKLGLCAPNRAATRLLWDMSCACVRQRKSNKRCQVNCPLPIPPLIASTRPSRVRISLIHVWYIYIFGFFFLRFFSKNRKKENKKSRSFNIIPYIFSHQTFNSHHKLFDPTHAFRVCWQNGQNQESFCENRYK